MGGGSKKNRSNAAKLALALVLGQAEGRLLEACSHYAEFCSLCTAAGLITPEQAESSTRHREMQENIWQQQKQAEQQFGGKGQPQQQQQMVQHQPMYQQQQVQPQQYQQYAMQYQQAAPGYY